MNGLTGPHADVIRGHMGWRQWAAAAGARRQQPRAVPSPTRAPAQLDAEANTVTPAYAGASALISGIFFGNLNGRADQELCHLECRDAYPGSKIKQIHVFPLRNSQHLPSQATECHRKSSSYDVITPDDVITVVISTPASYYEIIL